MTREKELIKQAEQLALLEQSEKPLDKLNNLLKDEDDIDMVSRVVTFFYMSVEKKLTDGEGSALIHKVKKLINTHPLPDDAEEQLDKLIESATTSAEKYQLSSMSEALFLKRHS